MKKNIHKIAAFFLLTSMTNSVSAYHQKRTSQSGIISTSLNLLLEAPVMAFRTITEILQTDEIINDAFISGYRANLFRFSDFGENIFERGAKKIGLDKKYAPWLGTATWHLFPINYTYNKLQQFFIQHGIKTNTEKTGPLFFICGFYALGATAGALWRKKVLAPTWKKGIKPAFFYAAHAARKTFQAAIA